MFFYTTNGRTNIHISAASERHRWLLLLHIYILSVFAAVRLLGCVIVCDLTDRAVHIHVLAGTKIHSHVV